MAALATDRDTPERAGVLREPPVAAATILYAGSMGAVNASGYAVPAAATATLKVLGRVKQRADNSSGAAGEIRAPIEAGIFRFANSASADLIALADIGADCYAVDDQTVAKTSSSNARPVAGKVFDVDAMGVWVKFG